MICDIGNHRIRRVNLQTGMIDTGRHGRAWAHAGRAPIAGTPLNGPRAITSSPDGNLYVVLREGNAVYALDPRAGRIYHVAGTGETGYSGDAARPNWRGFRGRRASSGRLTEASIWPIRKATMRIDLKTGIITTVVGTGERGNGPDGEVFHCRLRGRTAL